MCRPFSSGALGSQVPTATVVEGYFPGGFRINGVIHVGSILVTPSAVFPWRLTGSCDFKSVSPASLALLPVLQPQVEIVVIGCGLRTHSPPPSLLAFLKTHGIAYEILGTVNALSTFNFLAAEGRVVVGAMLPVGGKAAAAKAEQQFNPDASRYVV